MQVELSLEAGLLEQFPAFRDVLRASVYGCGRPFKHIAADLDVSPSKLSRMLADNPHDPIHFPADRLADLISATDDTRPVLWLAARFLVDADLVRKQALVDLAAMVPRLQALIKAAG